VGVLQQLSVQHPKCIGGHQLVIITRFHFSGWLDFPVGGRALRSLPPDICGKVFYFRLVRKKKNPCSFTDTETFRPLVIRRVPIGLIVFLFILSRLKARWWTAKKTPGCLKSNILVFDTNHSCACHKTPRCFLALLFFTENWCFN